jgi:predicted outer membrane repeat protein
MRTTAADRRRGLARWVPAMLAVMLVVAIVAEPIRAAPAGTVLTDCSESGFDAAVAAGEDITFSCGGPATIHLTHPAEVNSDQIAIDGGNVVTLTGDLSTTLLVVDTGVSLSLSNIILDRGRAKGAGGDGGAILNTGNLFLDHVRIQNSVADEFGGAIYSPGRVDLRNSSLASNSAAKGGAIYGPDTVEFNFDNSTFTSNMALDPFQGAGGAIWLGPGSRLTVSGGDMAYNRAQMDGGALYMGSQAEADFGPSGAAAAELEHNQAQNMGGAIDNDGGTLRLFEARVEYNQTLTSTIGYGFGGGIADLGALVVDHSGIANNQGRFGGGLFVGDGTTLTATAAITHTSFFDNGAAVYGGGLYTNVNSTTVTIEAGLFASNQAGSGGGLARTNANLHIAKSSFTDNTAQDGGGLFVQGKPTPDDAAYVEIGDTTVSGNLATGQHSGGIENSARLDLRSVTLKDNYYGLYSENGAASLLRSDALDNPGQANCDGDGSLPQSEGHNLATDASCNLAAAANDQIGVPAQLGPLTSDPLVFTEFHLPLPASPLINQAGPGCAPTDQRYAVRPDACDIGAIEFGGLLPRLFVPLIRR